MEIQLRQICMVAEKLEPVIEDLTEILGINSCYIDSGVGKFGLENNLMAVGPNFLEVVAPVEEETTAGRYLQRRGGDGGYMVITQADSYNSFDRVRQNALDDGVRIAWETNIGYWRNCQLHPRDMEAAFLEIEADDFNEFEGYWHPAGGNGWQDKVRQDITIDFLVVELQSQSPDNLAGRWSRVMGKEISLIEGATTLQLNNAALRFVELKDDRGPGISCIDVLVHNRREIIDRGRSRGCYVDEESVKICGVLWRLHER